MRNLKLTGSEFNSVRNMRHNQRKSKLVFDNVKCLSIYDKNLIDFFLSINIKNIDVIAFKISDDLLYFTLLFKLLSLGYSWFLDKI